MPRSPKNLLKEVRMEIIATIPPPVHEMAHYVARHSQVSALRYNTGSHAKVSYYSPEEVLRQLKLLAGDKKLYVDLKGRQLRVVKWSDPMQGTIVLNHPVRVDLPAKLFLRGERNPLEIVKILQNKIFTVANSEYSTGNGQAANVIGENRKIIGTLSGLDKAYLQAAKKLEIPNILLSYAEYAADFEEVYQIYPQARITAKIESPAGVNFILGKSFEKYAGQVNLMAARDDLFVELGFGETIMIALEVIAKNDPEAIVASRLLESLRHNESVSLPDLSDIILMFKMGYRKFMLSDEMCVSKVVFDRAMNYFAKNNFWI